MTTIQNAIGGKLVTSVSTRTQPVFNPATGEAIATLPLSTNDEIILFNYSTPKTSLMTCLRRALAVFTSISMK